MADDKPGGDYYKTLGVPRDASPEEIRLAWKRRAAELHPDRNRAPDAAEKFRELREAYRVLSDPNKRRAYDRGRRGSGERSGFPQTPEGSLADFFSLFFSSLRNRRAREVYLPENDLALLRALIIAELSLEDGKWEVRRAETEKRGFVPEVLYRVVRKGGKMFVYRRVGDWMDRGDRESPGVGVKVRNDSGVEERSRETFLEPFFLYGKGRELLENVSVPRQYGEYLNELYRLAGVYAEAYREGSWRGQAWRRDEIIIKLNALCVTALDLRRESGVFDPERELCRIIPMGKFDAELQRTERLIRRVEGGRRGPERQTSVPERTPGGWSGSAEEKG